MCLLLITFLPSSGLGMSWWEEKNGFLLKERNGYINWDQATKYCSVSSLG